MNRIPYTNIIASCYREWNPSFGIFFGDFSMLQKINIVILALCY